MLEKIQILYMSFQCTDVYRCPKLLNYERLKRLGPLRELTQTPYLGTVGGTPSTAPPPVIIAPQTLKVVYGHGVG